MCDLIKKGYSANDVTKNALTTHMSLYDFFMLHSNHLTVVDNKEEADIIISDSDNATLKPYDVDEIAAKWL